MSEKGQVIKLIWRITYAHTIAYFIAGILALAFMNYDELYVTIFSGFMRPTDEPIIFLASFLQIFRGILIALILLPLRKAFFEEKYGLIKLGIITVGLSYLSTIGPGIGSFEGYIFTSIPAKYQAIGYPETLLYVLLFIGILYISQKYAHKKIVTISSIIIVALISALSIMSYLTAL